MSRLLTWWRAVCGRSCVLAVTVLLAGVPLAAFENTTDARLTLPEGPWTSAETPLVVALAPAGDDLETLETHLSPLTRERGAALLTAVGGDDLRLAAVVNEITGEHKLPQNNVILAYVPLNSNAAWDSLGVWTWQLLLRQPSLYGGCLLVNPPAPENPEPVPGQGPTTSGSAVLLVTRPDRLESGQALQQALARWGLQTHIQIVRPEELGLYVGAGMSALLPASAHLSELTDPSTKAHFKAPEGWHFERRDGYLAVAINEAWPDDVMVELVSGMLVDRTFEDYVAEVGNVALRADWIELTDTERLPPPREDYLLHRFTAIDRRGYVPHRIQWYLVGSGDRIVSLRAVGTAEALNQVQADLQQMVNGVVFD